ncbi:caspase family protein [Kamptonema animale CS-326]|jgi:uncharacterized caspase-like protein|uniref:caspase family protein n=1 Tax=Kamptonema animale TaxID=92934 RepID=UPI00232A8592|nr:caspase family protein [Kamptonema animale]MDB9513899.1 caspase family protein [Kamptonema animale CS-326]
MKGQSLHIGLNHVNQANYNQIITQLKGCENDAVAMQNLAENLGYSHTKVLLNKEATHQAVKAAIAETAHLLEADDIFLLTYSGHGSQIIDVNGDEADMLDETWVLYDRELIDDELYELWSKFVPGVRIVVVSDSCHSGTITKSTDRVNYQGMVKEALLESVKASGILISACKDAQKALDGEVHSLFTSKLLEVWDDGKFRASHRSLRNAIATKLPRGRSPNYFLFGKQNVKFSRQQAFII